MNNRTARFRALTLALAITVPSLAVDAADEAVLNLYSARHYQTDEALYSNFSRDTGIRINRIEAGDDQLLERLKGEGANSPADVLLIVDAARLAQAKQLGLFQFVNSAALSERIPASMRDPDGAWFGFSSRGRLLVYNPALVKPADIASYVALADPKLRGMVCSRSGGHPYNLSLIAAQIAHLGEAKAEAWAKGLVANMARKPQGGDTDQIKAVAAGECGVALSNSYYYARLLRSSRPDEQAIVAKTAMVWPDQEGVGTHVNISGGGVARHAQHRANAIRFLEYLASDRAQIYFADGNNEWPAVKGVSVHNPALEKMGSFKPDALPIATLGDNIVVAQKLADRAGWR